MHLDAFLTLAGTNAVAGESTDNAQTGNIEVLQFYLGLWRQYRSNAEAMPLTIIKPIDAASPALCRICTTGVAIGTATLSICQPASTTATAKVVYYQVVLTNARITTWEAIGNVTAFPMAIPVGRAAFEYGVADGTQPLWTTPELAGQGPLELIQLAYQKITWNFKGGTGTSTATATYTVPAPSGVT